MILRDYHMHTTYCDGTASSEEMVRAAIARGLSEAGISGHSHTPFDESYCMSKETTGVYRQELAALREKYGDRISLKIGLEMDRYSDQDPAGFDYWIGSVHYIRVADPGPGRAGAAAAKPAVKTPAPEGCLPYSSEEGSFVYIPVDETADILRDAADAYFGGDLIALAECYFETAAGVVQATGCQIIGHFDLITKFNEPWIRSGTDSAICDPGEEDRVDPALRPLIDTSDPRYIAAWKKAVDQLLQYDVPFEINTGAMSKGYRSQPYPAADIRDYIREKGGRFILSSDSHRTDTLCYAFDQYEGEAGQER